MPNLSSTAQATIQHFASAMDMTAYEAPDGAFSFDFERSGRLSIVAADGDAVVISLTSKLLLEDLRGFAPLCAQAGYDAQQDVIVHSGLNKAGQPVLAIRTQAQNFNMPLLQLSFEALAQRFQAANL